MFSENGARTTRVAHALESGTVWVNVHGVLDNGVPFGGYKQSGIGRELGDQALEMYVCFHLSRYLT